MKNIYKSLVMLLMGILVMTSCDPQDNDDKALGTLPQASQLNFTLSPSADKPNIIVFKNESSINGVATWDFGNGSSAKGDNVSGLYPFKGDYTVTMTLYTTGGSVSITKNLSISNDDMSLLDTPMYNALTGGAANIEGKTWVFDQYVAGHFGVGPIDDSSPSWWSCPADGKLQSSLYTQEFTFIQVGVKMIWKNNGYVYSNAAGKNALGGNAIVPGAGDYDVEYTPKSSYTYSLDENNMTLTISDGGFLGHYAGTSKYEIIELTEDVMYLKARSTIETGNGWWYRFVPKEKNVKPIVPMKAVALAEDFEANKLKIDFARETMGKLDSIYANPAPLPINTSKRVYLYEKTNEKYSNISFTAADYKFDLTKINKVRMKVFIPSYNDYSTDKLQKKVAVKLQNSDNGGDAWKTQTEIAKNDLPTDKWIELEFDFSFVKDRMDYNKIVIQFGSEGHEVPGIFFFDDFSFNE